MSGISVLPARYDDDDDDDEHKNDFKTGNTMNFLVSHNISTNTISIFKPLLYLLSSMIEIILCLLVQNLSSGYTVKLMQIYAKRCLRNMLYLI